MAADAADEVLHVAELEIRPGEGLVLARGRALTISVRESALLVALARGEGHVIAREELYRRAWGGELREGDRSIDVYVRRLRVKLEEALPAWRFIHTHVGFGYRFSAERSHAFTTRPRGRNKLASAGRDAAATNSRRGHKEHP
jgi:DNA-binding response OmpR family regulator